MIRSAVTKLVRELEEEASKEDWSPVMLKASLKSLQAKERKLVEVDQKALNLLLDDPNADEDALEAESEAVLEYEAKISRVVAFAEELMSPPQREERRGTAEVPNLRVPSQGGKRTNNMRLPKIELRKFGGDMKDWLGWWAQYKKIHEDSLIPTSDKFVYLVQSMVEGSRAEKMMKSFPMSDANYPKAVEALTERFGKEKTLRQVYVRELLKLVITNNKNKGPVKITTFFDDLKAHLEALKSLGVGGDQVAVFLFPMVESSLPEDLLLAWQRSPYYGYEAGPEDEQGSDLQLLMMFLEKEVNNEEQRNLAQAGFEVNSTSHVKSKGASWDRRKKTEEDVPTASGLSNGHVREACIFCGKTNHSSGECFKAERITWAEKSETAKKKNVCFRCLRPGHRGRECKARFDCPTCKGPHCRVMCPNLPSNQKQETPPTAVNANQSCQSDVLLKTGGQSSGADGEQSRKVDL